MSTDSNKPVTFTNETIDKHFADERAAYKLSRVHDRVRADAIEVFNRTGKTPSQLAERLEEAKAVIRMFNTERRNCQKRIEKDGSLNHGPTCLSTVKSEYTPPEEYCVICRANTFLTPPTNG